MNAAQRRGARRALAREWPVGTLVTRRGTGAREYTISLAASPHGYVRLDCGDGIHVGAHINDIGRVPADPVGKLLRTMERSVLEGSSRIAPRKGGFLATYVLKVAP